MNKEELIKQFTDYVNTFNINDFAIKRKYDHSLRVMELSESIAKDLKLKEEDINVASVIGLLHDYGRFTQWDKYRTYSDLKSIDHGELAVKLLFENNEITKYIKDTKNYEVIKNAIKYHNKLFIPKNIDNYNELMCNIIRDADKLDIFYIFSVHKELIPEDDCEISKKIEKDFFNKKLVERVDMKNKSDQILLYLSFVYDLNFDSSFKYIKENDLINRIYNNFNNKEKYKKYFDYVKEYIYERID